MFVSFKYWVLLAETVCWVYSSIKPLNHLDIRLCSMSLKPNKKRYDSMMLFSSKKWTRMVAALLFNQRDRKYSHCVTQNCIHVFNAMETKSFTYFWMWKHSQFALELQYQLNSMKLWSWHWKIWLNFVKNEFRAWMK